MSRREIEDLREESKDMFYHAYNAYMDNAFPADELMPLTCQGMLDLHLLACFSNRGYLFPLRPKFFTCFS